MPADRPIESCQRRLLLVWIVLAALPLLLMVIQTLGGKYFPSEEHAKEAWKWLLGYLSPALILILGVFKQSPFADKDKDKDDKPKKVRGIFYVGTVVLSVLFLLLVLAAMLMVRLHITSEKPLYPLQVSDLWLKPLQSLVAAALGVLFVSASTSKAAD